jgi:N-acetylglucosaminyldiphosphoundecaprenol N-acetyl-beta-D-mannosaminyltransferase
VLHVSILDVRIDDTTYDEAVALADALIARGGAFQFATVNPEFVMIAQHDETFKRVLSETALNMPDGVGILWAAKHSGHPLRQRVAGVELMLALCERASQQGWRVFLLGAREGVAERTAAVLCERFRNLNVCGTFAGSPRIEDEPEIVGRVRDATPNLIFVAYGAPNQDKWLRRNLSRCVSSGGGIVGIGVGGAFDYISGARKRAPDWMLRIGLEWLHRLITQPWRWRRQLSLIRFVFSVLVTPSVDN